MAQPFTLTLLPNVKPLTLKPGWHKRAMAAERRHKATTAPQKGNPAADAKAVTYAVWLASRDGIAIPGDAAVSRVDWQPCAHGVRPRAVEWIPAPQPYRPAARGMAQPAVVPLLRIELPHWDYEAPAVIETTLQEWSAPVVTEVPCEPVAAPCEPTAPICEPIAVPCEPAACAHACEPSPRRGYGAPEAIGEARTVVAECLSHRARAKLLRRVGAVPPVSGHAAKGGAFSLTLSEARSAADVKCVRLIGMPRKPYTRRGLSCPPGAVPTRTNWDHPRRLEDLSWQMAHHYGFATLPRPYH